MIPLAYTCRYGHTAQLGEFHVTLRSGLGGGGSFLKYRSGDAHAYMHADDELSIA